MIPTVLLSMETVAASGPVGLSIAGHLLLAVCRTPTCEREVNAAARLPVTVVAHVMN